MKPMALDLFCGKGGATIGLQKSGWHVTGLDTEAWEGYPGDEFIKVDVREFHAKPGQFQFVWASPPCQEFSYRSLPFKRCQWMKKNVPPDKSLWEAAVRIAKEAGCPIVIENVRGAQPYMGKCVAHYGSFYLWGDVPLPLPPGNPTKGFGKAKRKNGKIGFAGEYERTNGIGKKAKNRKELAANNAIIPKELGEFIGKHFVGLMVEPCV